jgi:hypothetical protein
MNVHDVQHNFIMKIQRIFENIQSVTYCKFMKRCIISTECIYVFLITVVLNSEYFLKERCPVILCNSNVVVPVTSGVFFKYYLRF